MLLNRYVDLTEAIDEGNASLLDNSDFAEATNVPLVDDRTLPTKQVGRYYSKRSIAHLVVAPPWPRNVLTKHSNLNCMDDLISTFRWSRNARK